MICHTLSIALFLPPRLLRRERRAERQHQRELRARNIIAAAFRRHRVRRFTALAVAFAHHVVAQFRAQREAEDRQYRMRVARRRIEEDQAFRDWQLQQVAAPTFPLRALPTEQPSLVLPLTGYDLGGFLDTAGGASAGAPASVPLLQSPRPDNHSPRRNPMIPASNTMDSPWTPRTPKTSMMRGMLAATATTGVRGTTCTPHATTGVRGTICTPRAPSTGRDRSKGTGGAGAAAGGLTGRRSVFFPSDELASKVGTGAGAGTGSGTTANTSTTPVGSKRGMGGVPKSNRTASPPPGQLSRANSARGNVPKSSGDIGNGRTGKVAELMVKKSKQNKSAHFELQQQQEGGQVKGQQNAQEPGSLVPNSPRESPPPPQLQLPQRRGRSRGKGKGKGDSKSRSRSPKPQTQTQTQLDREEEQRQQQQSLAPTPPLSKGGSSARGFLTERQYSGRGFLSGRQHSGRGLNIDVGEAGAGTASTPSSTALGRLMRGLSEKSDSLRGAALVHPPTAPTTPLVRQASITSVASSVVAASTFTVTMTAGAGAGAGRTAGAAAGLGSVEESAALLPGTVEYAYHRPDLAPFSTMINHMVARASAFVAPSSWEDAATVSDDFVSSYSGKDGKNGKGGAWQRPRQQQSAAYRALERLCGISEEEVARSRRAVPPNVQRLKSFGSSIVSL